jgi:hypothetical protein
MCSNAINIQMGQESRLAQREERGRKRGYSQKLHCRTIESLKNGFHSRPSQPTGIINRSLKKENRSWAVGGSKCVLSGRYGEPGGSLSTTCEQKLLALRRTLTVIVLVNEAWSTTFNSELPSISSTYGSGLLQLPANVTWANLNNLCNCLTARASCVIQMPKSTGAVLKWN